MSDKNLTTIRIDKGGRFEKRVPVAVNGKVAQIKVGEDTPVGEHILTALQDAGVKFTVVSAKAGSGDAESGVGSASSSLSIDRDDQGVGAEVNEEGNRDALENAHELRQGTEPGTHVEGTLVGTVGGTATGTDAPAPTSKSALDHDNNGRVGGSKSGTASTASKGAAAKKATASKTAAKK